MTNNMDTAWKAALTKLGNRIGQTVTGIHTWTEHGEYAQIRSREPISEKDVRAVFDSPNLKVSQKEDVYWGNTTNLYDSGGHFELVERSNDE